VHTPPEEMAAETLAGFPVRFEWALDDLRALVSGRPVIAEGWGLRPELVVPLTGEPARMAVMVPTDRFREYQIRTLARATRVSHRVSDPQRAWRNRLARDRLVAADAVASARRLGVRVIEVDGSGAETVADLVGHHFQRYLSDDLGRSASRSTLSDVPYEWLPTAFTVLVLAGIEPYEVMQVLNGDGRRPVPVVDPATGLRLLNIYGRTSGGRLLVVTVRLAGGFVMRIVGARDMTVRERKEYERWESR
jgi:hypothetical protein